MACETEAQKEATGEISSGVQSERKTVIMGISISRELADKIRTRARSTHRSVSQYLRDQALAEMERAERSAVHHSQT